ncbi:MULTISPECIES: PTS sugar transporter subunit IIB [Bacilli]|uniref:PTS sugar transporter subunit IIB n=1 Tax=Bacilli TaxID=91061 RepID=UPI00054E4F7D|nr:PTS sugar transporter subunit IIB [Carnobacterium inhibens]
MKSKTILLVCTAGITTGLLVKNIQKLIEDEQKDYHIYSAPAIIVESIIRDQKIDALLMGPQSQYEISRLEELLNYKKVPYRLIDNEDYEILNAQAIYNKLKTML